MASLSTTHQQWKDATAEMLQTIPRAERQAYDEKIDTVKAEMRQSKFGRMILNWAEKNNTDILMDPQADGHGSYTVGSNTVLLNPNRTIQELTIVLAHELRHAWQDHQNLIPSQSMDDPKIYAAQVRFIEADAFAYSFITAYDLYGHDKLCNQNTYTNQTYAQTIKSAIDCDPHALQSGTAMFIAFNSFFNNAFLTKQYDTSSLHKYANAMGAKSTAEDIATKGISTKSSFNAVKFTSPKSKGINLTDFNETKKLGAMFDLPNYLNHGWSNMLKEPTYCGNLSDEFEQTCVNIQKQNLKNKGGASCPSP